MIGFKSNKCQLEKLLQWLEKAKGEYGEDNIHVSKMCVYHVAYD